MKHAVADVIDEAIKRDVWGEIFSPETDLMPEDLLKLSTDYSCHGCFSDLA